MNTHELEKLFSAEVLERLVPAETADHFFEALLGDADEGAYDISLVYKGFQEGRLALEFHLTRRQDKCLVCSLTYGLPNVFARHPVIDVKGVVAQVEGLFDGRATCDEWHLGRTVEVSADLHRIPLLIDLTGD